MSSLGLDDPSLYEDPNTERAQTNVRFLSGFDPKRAAEADALARSAGLPQQAAVADLPNLQAQQKQQASDAAIQRSPAVAKFLANPENAAVAHDVVDPLAQMETPLQYAMYLTPTNGLDFGGVIDALTGSKRGTFNARIAAGSSSALSTIIRGPFDYGRASYDTPGMLESQIAAGGGNPIYYDRQIASSMGFKSYADWVTAGSPHPPSVDVTPKVSRVLAASAAAARAATAGQPDAEAGDVVGGVAPYVLAGPLAPYAMASGGAGSTGQLAEAKGVSGTPAADRAIVGNAAVQGALGALPIGGVLGRFLPGFKQPIVAALANFGVHVAGGAATGAAMSVGANAVERQIDPTRSLTEGAGTSAAQMAILAGVFHAVPAVMEANRAVREQKAAAMQQAVTMAAANPLAERSPERFAEALNGMAPDAEIYIPAEKVQTYLQSAKPDEAARFIEATKIGDQLTHEAPVGADIVIKPGDYLAAVAKDPAIHDAFARDLRTSFDEPSLNEADKFLTPSPEEIAAAGENMVKGLAVATEAIRPAAQVYADVYDQITKAGFSQDTARQQAILYAARYETRAARQNTALGPDAQTDAWEQYQQAGTGEGVKITSDAAPKRAVKGARTLAQPSWEEALARGREVSGLRAAIRDPQDGTIYTGSSHLSAIAHAARNAPAKGPGAGLYSRLHEEWDKGSDNTGFVDQGGNFISRTEVEKRWNIATMEDARDFLRDRGKRTFYQGGPADPVADLASANLPAPFFSALRRAVDGPKTPGKASAEQWLKTLEQTPGVKAAELEWSGLKDFLAVKHDAGETVTKQEVQGFLDHGGVQLKETVLGGEGTGFTEADVSERADQMMGARQQELIESADFAPDGYHSDEVETEVDQEEDGTPIYESRWAVMYNGDRIDNYDHATEDAADEARYEYESEAERNNLSSWWGNNRRQFEADARDELEANSGDGQTKWSDYTHPGGDNYRELLISLAPHDEDAATALAAKRDRPRWAAQGPNTHWDENNVIAHTRVKSREDATGKRVLAIEEMQSDWHQKASAAARKRLGDAQSAVILLADKVYPNGELGMKPLTSRVESENRATLADNVQKAVTALRDAAGSVDDPGTPGEVARALRDYEAAKAWRGYSGTVKPEELARLREVSQKAQERVIETGKPLAEIAVRLMERELGHYERDRDENDAKASALHEKAQVDGDASMTEMAQFDRMARDSADMISRIEDAIARIKGELTDGVDVAQVGAVAAQYLSRSAMVGPVDGSAEAPWRARQEAVLRAREASDAVNQAQGVGGIAEAPFASTWPELVLKRLIRLAVDEGHEAVTWIHGDQQNGGKTPDDDGAWFYDKVLINTASGLIKKYGGKVGEIDMRSDASRRVIADNEAQIAELSALVARSKEELDAELLSVVGAEGPVSAERAAALDDELRRHRRIDSLRERNVQLSRPRTGLGLQHGFVITPELREAALSGFSLFQKERGNITFGPKGAVIRLFAGRDLSTLLHETGHLWLEEMQADAMDPHGPQQARDDFATVRRWMGLQDGVPIDVEHHEQFARGVESYLRDGQAPTSGLRGAFQRFGAWLSRIYRRATDLNVTVSPEIRDVFDRLLATDEELADAKTKQGMAPLFASAADGGMTEAEFKAYAKSITDADEAGRAKLLGAVMKGITNRKTAEWRVERERRYEDALAQVDQAPDVRALNFITSQKQPLDRAAVEAIIGKDGVDSLPKRVPPIVQADGVHPDMVAEATGSESGEAMLRQLQGHEAERQQMRASGDRRTVREARAAQIADQQMAQAHGDPLHDGSIEAEALDAVNDARRSEQVGMEIAALARATGAPDGRWRRQQLKTWAQGVMAERVSGEIRPAAYLKAERTAANEAQRALLKGDHATALEHKWNQLANMMLFRAAQDAHDAMDKASAKFDRITTAKDETLAKSRNMDWVAATRSVLAAFGYEAQKNSPAEYLRQIANYDPETSEMIQPLVDSITHGAQPFAKLKFADAMNLSALVDQLWTLSRQSKVIEIDGRRMEIEAATGELIARLHEDGDPKHLIDVTRAVSDKEKNAGGLLGVYAAVKKVEEWAMRRGEPFTRLIFRPISKAADAYRHDKNTILPRLLTAMRAISEGTGKPYKIAAPELNYTFGHAHGAGLAEVVGALRHIGNESNKRKLLLGRGWATENDDGTLNTGAWDHFLSRMISEGKLTKAHFDYVQAEWDMHEEIKPQAQKAHHALYGRYFAEVTADPFDTPFGRYRGGYAPAKVDPHLNADAEMRVDAATVLNGTAGSFAFPTASNGFTKSRVEYNQPLDLDLRLAISQMDEVLRFAHLGPAVRSAQRLLMNREMAATLRAYDPAAWNGLLLPWLKRSVSQQTTTPTGGPGGRWVDKAAGTLSQRTGMAIMFGSLTNTAQQISGLSVAALRTGNVHMLGAVKDYLLNPKGYTERTLAASKMMADRNSHQMVELQKAANDIVLNPNLYDKAVGWTQKHTYFMQHGFQNVLDPIVWGAAYNHGVEIKEEDPAAYADMVVRTSQSSSNAEDVSAFTTGSAWSRPFKMFTGYWLDQANLLDTEFRKPGSLGRKAEVYAMGVMIPAIITNLIAKTFQGNLWDDSKDVWENLGDMFLLAQVQYALSMVPVAGNMANLVINRFDDKPYNDRLSASPVASMIETIAGIPKDAFDTIAGKGNDKRTITDVLTGMSMLTGLPLAILAKPLGYEASVAQGKTQPTSAVDHARGLITGTPSQASRQ